MKRLALVVLVLSLTACGSGVLAPRTTYVCAWANVPTRRVREYCRPLPKRSDPSTGVDTSTLTIR